MKKFLILAALATISIMAWQQPAFAACPKECNHNCNKNAATLADSEKDKAPTEEGSTQKPCCAQTKNHPCNTADKEGKPCAKKPCNQAL